MRTGTHGASSPSLTSCRPLCSLLQVSMLLTLSPRCSIFLHLHPQFLSTSGRRQPPLLCLPPAAGHLPLPHPKWSWGMEEAGAGVWQCWVPRWGHQDPDAACPRGTQGFLVTVRKDGGTFHGDTPSEPHSCSVWNVGFAGPWALGWVRVLECDASQEKSLFLILPQFPPRPEYLQCHSQGTQSGQSPTCTPQTCCPPLDISKMWPTTGPRWQSPSPPPLAAAPKLSVPATGLTLRWHWNHTAWPQAAGSAHPLPGESLLAMGGHVPGTHCGTSLGVK